MITYFKSNNIMNELEKNQYLIITKKIYRYSEKIGSGKQNIQTFLQIISKNKFYSVKY